MLKLPHNPEHEITIVGIDPGTETLGFSELVVDLHTFEPTSWTPQTYVGSKLICRNLWLEKIHGARMMRLAAHGRNLLKLFDQIDPYLIGCESPFINTKAPQAFGALVEAVYTIHQTVIAHNPWKKLYTLEPSTVKNSVGAKGNADKQAMRVALMNNTPLAKICTRDYDTLDEHEIDSGAVAYAMLKNLKAISENKPPS